MTYRYTLTEMFVEMLDRMKELHAQRIATLEAENNNLRAQLAEKGIW